MKVFIFFLLAAFFGFAWYFVKQIKKQFFLLNQIDFLRYHGLPCFYNEKTAQKDLLIFITGALICLLACAGLLIILNNYQ